MAAVALSTDLGVGYPHTQHPQCTRQSATGEHHLCTPYCCRRQSFSSIASTFVAAIVQGFESSLREPCGVMDWQNCRPLEFHMAVLCLSSCPH